MKPLQRLIERIESTGMRYLADSGLRLAGEYQDIELYFWHDARSIGLIVSLRLGQVVEDKQTHRRAWRISARPVCGNPGASEGYVFGIAPVKLRLQAEQIRVRIQYASDGWQPVASHRLEAALRAARLLIDEIALMRKIADKTAKNEPPSF